MFWYGYGFWRLRLGIAGLVLGGMLLFAGFREWQLGAAASAQPEDLTLEQLIARGPDGNPNVRLHDFQLGDPASPWQDIRLRQAVSLAKLPGAQPTGLKGADQLADLFPGSPASRCPFLRSIHSLSSPQKLPPRLDAVSQTLPVILTERGFLNEVQVAMRSLLEMQFKIAARCREGDHHMGCGNVARTDELATP